MAQDTENTVVIIMMQTPGLGRDAVLLPLAPLAPPTALAGVADAPASFTPLVPLLPLTPLVPLKPLIPPTPLVPLASLTVVLCACRVFGVPPPGEVANTDLTSPC